jgi:hypothetical protein
MARRSRWTQEQEEAEAEAETGTPCAREQQCAESDYQGNATLCPRAFCEKDEQWIGKILREMPGTYVGLRLLLARSQQQEERVSGSREAPIPLATDIEAFMREIVHVTLDWEEQVMAVRRLSDLPSGRRRDAVSLVHACRTLSTGLSTLLSLAPETKVRYVPVSRLYEEDLDYRIWWDTAGDAWADTTMDGTDAGLELIRVSGRARGMLGLNRGRRRITEVPCDDCKATTLVQWEGRDGGWEPVIRCTNCPNAYIGTRFELMAGRIYKVQMEKLKRHEKVA